MSYHSRLATDIAEDKRLGTIRLYYNIFSNSTEAFLGTVAVETHTRYGRPINAGVGGAGPAARAKAIACDILGGDGAPGGIKAIMSTREIFIAHGLNRS